MPRESSATRPRPPAGDPLVRELAGRLAEEHPFDMAAYASQIIEASTERPVDRWSPDGTSPLDLPTLLEAFLETDEPEVTGLLAAFAPMVDEVTARRIRAELARRGRDGLPVWAQLNGPWAPTEVWEMTHVLGDGDNLFVGWRWPSGHEATAIVYIDHNLGTLVKDAFVVAQPVPEVIELYRERLEPEDLVHSSLHPTDPADARVRIEAAISRGEISLPPFETDSWPAARPMIEAVVRLLPTGGRVDERPDWPDAARDELVQAVLDDPVAALNGRHHDVLRPLLECLVWFGCDYGPGDPLRWSPVAVEIVMVDWFPRKIIDDAAVLAEMPLALRGLIRHAHSRRGIDAKLTVETLAAVDRWEPEYLGLIADEGRSREAEALARAALAMATGRAGDVDGDVLGDVVDELARRELEVRNTYDYLADQIGGRSVAAALTDDEVGDEPLDVDGVPEDVVDKMREIAEVSDRVCDQVLDVEFRTLARRMLHRVGTRSPASLRRRARSDIWAASIVAVLVEDHGHRAPADRRDGSRVTRRTVAEAARVSPSSLGNKMGTVRKAAGIERYGRLHAELMNAAARRAYLVQLQRAAAEE